MDGPAMYSIHQLQPEAEQRADILSTWLPAALAVSRGAVIPRARLFAVVPWQVNEPCGIPSCPKPQFCITCSALMTCWGTGRRSCTSPHPADW